MSPALNGESGQNSTQRQGFPELMERVRLWGVNIINSMEVAEYVKVFPKPMLLVLLHLQLTL